MSYRLLSDDNDDGGNGGNSYIKTLFGIGCNIGWIGINRDNKQQKSLLFIE